MPRNLHPRTTMPPHCSCSHLLPDCNNTAPNSLFGALCAYDIFYEDSFNLTLSYFLALTRMRLPGGASTYVSVPINCLILVHYRRASQDFRIHRSPTPSSETGGGTPGNFQRLPILVFVYFYFHTFRLMVAFTYMTFRSHIG